MFTSINLRYLERKRTNTSVSSIWSRQYPRYEPSKTTNCEGPFVWKRWPQTPTLQDNKFYSFDEH